MIPASTRLAGFVLAGSLSASFACAQAPIIGIWQFDETTGTTAMDIGPFGNNGTLFNYTTSAWVPGQAGNALMFDGVDDYVELAANGGMPFTSGFGEAFTISFWINGNASDDDRVLALSSSTTGTPLLTFGTGRTGQGNEPKFQIFRRTDANVDLGSRYSNADVFDNTWHQVTYIEHSNYARIYIDGQLDTSIPIATGGDFYTFDIVTLGAIHRPTNATPECCHWTGMIDNLQIYGYAASTADVATLFAGGLLGNPRPSVASYGIGCDAGNSAAFGPFSLAAFGAPLLGGAMELRCVNGHPGTTPLLVVSLSKPTVFDLSTIGGASGCALYSQPAGSIVAPMAPNDAFGSSLIGLPLPIPNLPFLAGLPVTMAALDTAPTVIATNGVAMVLGN